ncbi:conserved membrane protein of unknown function [Pararobbsia alpina]|jgi:hypothetical protein|uniref:hypothetical protein n=1 Tax=Pararobbsia alpina TaxID=621374 RepID=UPI0039A6FDD8
MQSPTGSVVALSSAASTVFSIGMVFLGYWGIHESGTWGVRDYVVVLLAMGGFICLGSVPWFATTPMERADDESKIRVARRAFLCGVTAMWLSVLTSLV